MHRPQLLILDEPTQGLDPIVQQTFHELVLEARAAGQTVFLSSHVLPEVERVCDRVGIIREGRLIAVEDVGELKTHAVREVELHFSSPVPADAFAGLAGVRDLRGTRRRHPLHGRGVDGRAHQDGGTVRSDRHGEPRAEPGGHLPGVLRSRRIGADMIVWRKTLTDQRRALIGWAFGMAALVLLYASFYPSIKGNASLNEYFDSLPDAVRNMVGRMDFSSPTCYLQSEVFSIMGPLLLMILAIGAGARATAGEEEHGTLDLLLANPIPRRRVALEKFGAMVAATAGVGVVLWASVAVFGPLFGLRLSLVHLGEAVLSAVLLALGFGAGAFTMGCWRGKRGLAIAVVSSVAVVTYLFNVLAPSVEAIHSLQKLSPFYYYIGNDPLRNGLDPVHALVLAAIIVVMLGLALLAFERRDLRRRD